ncbi:transcriptional regulator MetR, substrate-binding, LysR family protein [Psychromonas ingrahamii 37]|uniref:HTH-type transcriptional regulator MetR n=1 Tax=Psychromonas ingrahamii (strain DSM 17664 / CCUG 51855 / 37) TaxID=357804 RepID=A1SUX8_PSYIN|nr:LysR family transcriptional regulator [Psychromonas ingrahamii]ABM03293.1 transcriptional regulator MetR, substrate-binding, LysR family protein [Psychromonas ingrahamii 37]
MIEIKHLKTLTTLNATGSLIDTARQLHLTQSAISHQLKELEGRLNCALFIRKSRPIRFTVSGLRLLDLAEQVLPQINNAERDVARFCSGNAGRLHMAIECHSCFQWLMPAIDKFRDSWPEVELDFCSGFSFLPLPALKRGNLDLVVTSDPQPIEGISYIPLFRYQPMLALSRHHRLAHKNYIEAEDLSQETLITYPVEKERLDIFNLFLTPEGVSPAKIRHADLTLMMLQLVASGRGVAGLPNWALFEYLQKDYVVARRLGKEGIWNTLYAAVREEQQGMAYLQDFIKTAITCCFKDLKGIKVADCEQPSFTK